MQLIKNMDYEHEYLPDEKSDDEENNASVLDYDKPHLTNLNEDPLLNNKI